MLQFRRRAPNQGYPGVGLLREVEPKVWILRTDGLEGEEC